MARGWESKSVESQQDDARERKQEGPPLTAEARARRERTRELTLALAQVRDQQAAATQPNHRAMLERAAASLEAELASLT